ncbi:hypothetical protein RND71_009010 [Anisodus tanguticus]|uniref:Uncharacterized protein n=1 Tax=Anisodus tanguticus TaxID=243964 RepID=A0AAE1SS02_9SOLA|nr:hypothetical protein RND71_009010 [Anisodus tanguticus]
MGRQPCCDKNGVKKGPWSAEEDKKLINFILNNGQCCWRSLPKLAGLLRCGKSCRLRWTNYLRPDLKRGLLSEYEEKMVIDLHAQLGNRWSKIASHLHGRTDNEIKNHWNTHIKKKLKKMGIDPVTHKPITSDQPNIDQQLIKNQPIIQQEKQTPIESTIRETKLEAEQEGNKNMGTTLTTTIITTARSEISWGRQENKNIEVNNNGFCTDEVPLISPNEILVPSESTTPSTSSSQSSNMILEDLQFLPSFDNWQCDFNRGTSWENDDFSSILDYLLNDDSDISNTISQDWSQILEV